MTAESRTATALTASVGLVHIRNLAENGEVKPAHICRMICYVPTRRGALSLRSAAMTDSAVMRPVLGLSDGIFSIENEKRAESESTSMEWQFRVTVGSAQISIVVR